MSALFALLAAGLVGAADFIGGHTARRISPVAIGVAGQGIGLLAGVPIALLWGWEDVTGRDVGFSVAAGVSVGLGLACFYAAMASGLISLVAPVTAVVGALVPVGFGLAQGERPSVAASAGIVLALVAIGTVSFAPSDTAAAGQQGIATRVLALSITAGVLFGFFFVGLAEADEDAGMWPVTLQRIGSVAALGAIAAVLRVGLGQIATAARPGLLLAGFEVSAFMFLLLALQRGDLTVVGVLASLYPVTTVLLARALLHERLTRLQLAGVALALGAVALVSAG